MLEFKSKFQSPVIFPVVNGGLFTKLMAVIVGFIWFIVRLVIKAVGDFTLYYSIFIKMCKWAALLEKFVVLIK